MGVALTLASGVATGIVFVLAVCFSFVDKTDRAEARLFGLVLTAIGVALTWVAFVATEQMIGSRRGGFVKAAALLVPVLLFVLPVLGWFAAPLVLIASLYIVARLAGWGPRPI